MAGELMELMESKRNPREVVVEELESLAKGVYEHIVSAALLDKDLVGKLTDGTSKLLSDTSESGLANVVKWVQSLQELVSVFASFGKMYRIVDSELLSDRFGQDVSTVLFALHNMFPQGHEKTVRLLSQFWAIADEFKFPLSNAFVNTLDIYLSSARVTIDLSEPIRDWVGDESITFSPSLVDVHGLIHSFSLLYSRFNSWLPILAGANEDCYDAIERFKSRVVRAIHSEVAGVSNAVWSLYRSKTNANAADDSNAGDTSGEVPSENQQGDSNDQIVHSE